MSPENETSAQRPWKFLLSLLRKNGGTLTVVLLMTSVVALLAFIPIHFTRIILDQAFAKRDFDVLLQATIFTCGALLGSGVLGYFQSIIYARMGVRMLGDISIQVFSSLMRKGDDYFTANPVGEISNKVIRDVEQMGMFLSSSILITITNLGMFCGITIYLLLISWKLTLAAMITLPFNILFFFIFQKRLSETSLRAAEAYGNVSGDIVETLRGIKEVKSFGTEKAEVEEFSGNVDRLVTAAVASSEVGLLHGGIMRFLMSFAPTLLYFVGGILIINKELSAGDVVAFAASVAMLFSSTQSIANQMTSFTKIQPVIDRLSEFMDPPRQSRGSADMVLGGAISARAVTYTYPDGGFGLEDISFDIEAGSKVAIVGTSGSGKSTIVNVITGFVEEYQGNVIYDDNELRTIDREAFLNQVAFVIQRPFLFRRTLLENLCYGNQGASFQTIERACKLASVYDDIVSFGLRARFSDLARLEAPPFSRDELRAARKNFHDRLDDLAVRKFIRIIPEEECGEYSSVRQVLTCIAMGALPKAMPDGERVELSLQMEAVLMEAIEETGLSHALFRLGLEYQVTEDGGGLSGGQIHRIAIARALAKTSAKILFLDEPTEGLSRRDVAIVEETINRICEEEKRTIVFITHDFSIVDSADLVLVFDNGRIVQHGTFEELKDSGLFKALYQSQFETT